MAIYCKTGNHSLKERQHAEEQEYAVFDRTDFLSVLKRYRGTNDILINFRRYLKRWQEETDSFREWANDSDERMKRGWEGLYRYIEENCLDNSGDDWGALTSRRVGGYNALWIEPTETSKNSKFRHMDRRRPDQLSSVRSEDANLETRDEPGKGLLGPCV